MKLLRWDGWFLHYNTGYLRKHKPSVPCSVLLSNNYVIIKPCSRNIKGRTNLAYSENVNLEVPVRLSFQNLPLAKESPQNAPTLRQDVVLSIIP